MPDPPIERKSRARLIARGGRWLDRHLAAVAIVVSAALFVPGAVLGASWWNEIPGPVGLITVGLSFLVGWRVGFPATVVALVALAFGSTAGELSGAVVSMWVFTVPAWAMGQVMRSRSHLSAQLAERAREIEQEREGFAREAVRYERARIARDLHDIVAHNLSLIVVQAGAGRRASPEHPDVLAESLRHIGAGADSAREEIDQLVGLLGDDTRNGNADGGLCRLDELLRGAATSGLSITYSFAGSREPVAPAVAEVAYRVTQEGIANALKHAPGSAIRVEVEVTSVELSLAVENGPPIGADASLATVGGGFGLVGLRERVTALGGTLEAQPIRVAGWRLAARLPLLTLDQNARRP